MSQESARHRASLWLRQAQDDLRAARLLQEGGQAAQACFLAKQVGEKAIKALLAADDRDLRSHSLKALLQELDQAHAQRWQRQARMLWVRTRRWRIRPAGSRRTARLGLGSTAVTTLQPLVSVGAAFTRGCAHGRRRGSCCRR